MGFLSKLLKGIGIVTSLITGIEPMFGQGQGGAKKDFVLQILVAIIGMSESIAQKDIVDEKAFSEGLSKVIEGVVQMLNASIWKKKP